MGDEGTSRTDQFSLKYEKLRKDLIVQNIYFCLQPLFAILMCVFFICSLKQTEELGDSGLLQKAHTPFWISGVQNR